MKQKNKQAQSLAKLRWSKTTKKQRKAHSKKMLEAKMAKKYNLDEEGDIADTD